jgi:AcrR family transcriptional regulator
MYYDDTRVKARNREHIVNTALSLFIEHGIFDTSVSDIVEDAKIERKTFYNYFEDKEELAHYIYYLLNVEFYSEGFSLNDYLDYESGYLKLEAYLNHLMKMYDSKKNIVRYFAHYEYYFVNIDLSDLIEDIEFNIDKVDPYLFYTEGIDDSSIKESLYPIDTFESIIDSIYAYTKNMVIREEGFNPTLLWLLVDTHLKAIKKS